MKRQARVFNRSGYIVDSSSGWLHLSCLIQEKNNGG
jgi:hypothetical protein